MALRPRANPSMTASWRLAQPLRQRHRVQPEIDGNLLNRPSILAVASDLHDVVTELFRIRPCHGDILPARPSWASDLRCHLSRQQPPCMVM